MRNTFRSIVVAALVAAAAGNAAAHNLDGHEEDVNVVQAHVLPEAPGKQAVVLTVHYAPGTKSAAHTHPDSVFAYVLDGEVVSQLDGEAPVIYHTGKSWYEAPGANHLVSRNASMTRPATLLEWMVTGSNEAPVLPLKPAVPR
jgi:quercetin dioxygenase-like cupin family protein